MAKPPHDFFCSDFDTFFFAYASDNFNQKKNSYIYFLTKLSLIFLEYFETYFDQVTSKIGAKINNYIIYGDNLVYFLRILSTKSTIYQKLKIF